MKLPDGSPYAALSEKMRGVPHATGKEPRIRSHDHADCGDHCVEPPAWEKVLAEKDSEIERLRAEVHEEHSIELYDKLFENPELRQRFEDAKRMMNADERPEPDSNGYCRCDPQPGYEHESDEGMVCVDCGGNAPVFIANRAKQSKDSAPNIPEMSVERERMLATLAVSLAALVPKDVDPASLARRYGPRAQRAQRSRRVYGHGD